MTLYWNERNHFIWRWIFLNKYLKENILEEGSYINVADDSLIAFLDNKYQAVKIYC